MKPPSPLAIFAVNSSPRTGGASKTELMLNHLVAGMREAGAEAEVVNLREKRIKSCIGCFTCWSKTPGRCIHQDDMTLELFPKYMQADLLVFATPLYYHTMNGAMSTFRERTLPGIHPHIEYDENGKSYHPMRYQPGGMVWLSVCGYAEESEFDALSDYLHRTRHKDVTILAEIYRSASEAMTSPGLEEITKDVLQATTRAGRELVESMRISPETMARIRQPIVDPKQYAQMGALFWNSCIAEGVTPKEFHEKNMVPRPDSLESFMTFFAFALNSDAVGDQQVKLQFHFSGELADSCYFVITGDKVEAEKGTTADPDLVIDTPFEIWMDILTRKADGERLFLEQKYRVEGDLNLMIQLFQQTENG